MLLPVVLTLVAQTEENAGAFFEKIENLCYPKWALEALLIANAERFDIIALFPCLVTSYK